MRNGLLVYRIFFPSGDGTACTTFQVQDFDFCPLLCWHGWIQMKKIMKTPQLTVNDIVVSLEET